MNKPRRQWLQQSLGWVPAALLPAGAPRAATTQAPGAAPAPTGVPPAILPTDVLRFPRDFGAHPAFQTEWWYITGALHVGAPSQARSYGFQITFFRSRVDVAARNPSQFAAKQLVFAHTALSDLQGQQLLHDQRIARAGFGLAQALEGDTDLTLRDWTLRRQGPTEHSVYRSHIAARDFTLDLSLAQTQSLLLQGQAGYSRKGPQAEQASHYYSQPQLQVQGTLAYQGQQVAVQGRAWLDHEWSESLLDAQAVGWDWVGMNLDDGRALTAFRLRRADGSTLWSGGSLRTPGQAARALSPGEVRFTPGRRWTSPATRAAYPVQWQLDVAGVRYTVRALLDAQELDSRASTGGVYWEGLSELLDAGGRSLGQGYLEMTGYAAPLQL